MRTLIAIIISALVLVACGSDEPLAGSDLEPAEVPTNVEPATLALPFRVDLPGGYWEEGAHRYRFIIDCPHLGDPLESSPVEFRVTQLTRTIQGPVYLRLSGLSTGIMMPANVGAIHPTQPTIAVVSFLGLDQTTVDAATAECSGLMEYDGGVTEVISPAAPFRP